MKADRRSRDCPTGQGRRACPCNRRVRAAASCAAPQTASPVAPVAPPAPPLATPATPAFAAPAAAPAALAALAAPLAVTGASAMPTAETSRFPRPVSNAVLAVPADAVVAATGA